MSRFSLRNKHKWAQRRLFVALMTESTYKTIIMCVPVKIRLELAVTGCLHIYAVCITACNKRAQHRVPFSDDLCGTISRSTTVAFPG